MAFEQQQEPSIRDLVRRIAQRRLLVVSVGLAVFVGIALWTFLATPRYRSAAVLRIESKSTTPGLPDALKDLPGAGLAGLGKDELETEIGVLKSSRMEDAAIDGLALAVQVKPAADRARVMRARIVDSSDVEGEMTLTRRNNGRYAVDADGLEGFAKLPAELATGDSVRVGSVVFGLPESLKGSGPDHIEVKFLPRYKVHELMDKRLTIRRQEGGSRLVEISFEDPDRRLAAQVVERIVHEYVAYTLQVDVRDEDTQMTELRAALAASAVRLAGSEDKVRVFQQREKIVVPEEQAGQQVKRIALLDTRVDAVRIERNALAQLLGIIGGRARGGKDPAAFRQLATFPSLITNRAIQDLLQALIELETKRSALLVTRNEGNAEVSQLTARVVELEQQLFLLGSQYLESLDQQLASTSRTVNSLTDTLVALPATAMRFGQLLRDSKIANEEYLQLIKQLKFAQLQELLRKEKVRIVDVPRVANLDDPAFPRRKVQLALGAVLALLLAFAAGLFAELWAPARPE